MTGDASAPPCLACGSKVTGWCLESPDPLRTSRCLDCGAVINWIDPGDSPESRCPARRPHEWAEITACGESERIFRCLHCGAEKREPFPPRPIDHRALLRKFIVYTLTSDPTDQAAMEIAAEWFGNRIRHSPDFTPDEKAELVRLMRQAETIEAAFAEEVEQWDL